jgi:hypothetical protein
MTQTASLPPHATRDLARFATGPRFEILRPWSSITLKLCLLDGLGVGSFGAGLP